MTTTNSKHNNKIYSNLIKDKELIGINQIWYSDITYIRINIKKLPNKNKYDRN